MIYLDKEDIRLRRLMHFSKNEDSSPAISIKKQPSTSQKINQATSKSGIAPTPPPKSTPVSRNTGLSHKGKDQFDWGEDFEATVKMCVDQGMDEEEAFDFVLESIAGGVVHAAPEEADEWDDFDSGDEWMENSMVDTIYSSSTKPVYSNTDNEGLAI